MAKTTRISEMQKFHFGNNIIYADGEDGTLLFVIFDPSTRRLTHLGVRQGRFFGKTYTLPYSVAVGATADGIQLTIKRDEAASKHDTGAQGALLDAKSVVENAGATTGTLMMVAVHPENGELAYLVAHHLKEGQDTLIQQPFITGLAAGHISINVPADVLESLPPFRPDAVLQQEVEAAIFDFVPLHIELKGINARVLDSVLYLDGSISSALRSDAVTDQAFGVLGLLEVRNNLVPDDRLAADLAMALGRDSRTRDLPIGVYPRLGVVRLSGAVHNSQQKAAAGEIARQFPGVRSVINDLVINADAELLRVMSASEGGEAEDIVPGQYVRHTQ
jgi:osmotically-inducible protein OsmY